MALALALALARASTSALPSRLEAAAEVEAGFAHAFPAAWAAILGLWVVGVVVLVARRRRLGR